MTTSTDNYFLIYADPPWGYADVRTGGSFQSGAGQQYPVMTVADIAALPVAEVCAPNAILGLWATNPNLPAAITVMASWGFQYKTTWPWLKTGRLGLGRWGRVDVEFLLVGIRGQVKPPLLPSETSSFSAPVGSHSAKPQEARDRMERVAARCFGSWETIVTPVPGRDRPKYTQHLMSLATDLPSLELFARETAPGWDCLGHDLGESVEAGLARIAAAQRAAFSLV